jgi:hypothetical protein
MTGPHLRRLQKLEEKRAKENCGIVTRITWERPDGPPGGPRVTWHQEPDPKEQELHPSLDLEEPTAFEIEFPEQCSEE